MTPPAAVVFLLDVDNTLLDNDRIIADLQQYLTRVGAPSSFISRCATWRR